MSKDKLKASKMDANNELNFDYDFGNEVDAFASEESKSKSRSPVGQVFKGIVGGAKSKISDVSFTHSVIKDALPKEYGEVASTVEKTIGSVYSVYNDAVKEVKPQAAKLAKKIDALVPEESKFLKKITGKIKDMTGAKSYEAGASMSKEAMEDKAVESVLADVFNRQNEINNQVEAKKAAEDKVRDTVEGQRYRANYGLTAKIAEGITKLTSYQETITNAFQRKSLELQFRTYFVLGEQLRSHNKFYEIFERQNESIVKNTSLPEFVKIHNNERYAEMVRGKFMSNINEGLFGDGDIIKTAGKRLRNKVMEKVSSVKDSLEAALMGTDSIEMIKDVNENLEEGDKITGKEMAGTAIGSAGAAKGIKKLIEKIAQHIPEEYKEKGLEYLYKAADINANKGAWVQDKIKNNETLKNNEYSGGLMGMASRIGQSVADLFKMERPDLSLDNKNTSNELKDVAVFDNKFHRSVTEVIPGFLARILRENVMSRTGMKNANLTLFDFDKGKFTNSKEFQGDVKNRLDKAASTSMYGYNLQNIVRQLFGDEEPDKKSVKTIKEFFADISEKDMVMSAENIMNTKEFKKLDSPIGEMLRKALEDKMANDKTGQEKYKLSKNIKSVTESVPDIRKEIEKYVNAGYAEQLEELGLIIQDDDGRGYEIDFDMYKRIVRNINIDGDYASGARAFMKMKEDEKKKAKEEKLKNAGVVPSDVNVKTDIKKFSPKRALDAIKNTKLYSWFYKKTKGDGGAEQHVGPMAQDVKDQLGEKAAPGGKQLDLVNMNGANMAATQALSEKIEKLGADNESLRVLKDIRKNTFKTNQLLAKGGIGNGIHIGNPFDGFSASDSVKKVARGAKNAAGSVTSMAWKLVKGTFNVGESILSTISGKASSLKDNIAAQLKDEDSFISKLLTNVTDTAKSALEFGRKTLFETLPKGVKGIYNFAKDIKQGVVDFFNRPIDVYIKGLKNPVLRVNLIKEGFYIDKLTGKVIESLADIKGEVVDRLGNVVITQEDFQNLVDVHGNKIKLKVSNFVTGALGLAAAGLSKVNDIGRKILSFGANRLGGLGDKVKGMFSGMSGGISFGMDKTNTVLLEIRNILLKKFKMKNPGSGEKSVVENLSQKIKESGIEEKMKSFDIAERWKNFKNEIKAKKDKLFNGPSLKDRFKSAKEKIASKFNLPDLKSRFEGSKLSDIYGNVKDKFNKAKDYFKEKKASIKEQYPELKEKAKERFDELKENTKNKYNEHKENAKNKYNELKEQTKNKYAETKDKVKEKYENAKQKGSEKFNLFKKLAGNKYDKIKDTISSKVDKAKTAIEDYKERKKNFVGPKQSLMSKIKSKLPLGPDDDGDGVKDGSVADRLKKLAKEKAERLKNRFAKADLTAKYRSNENIIDTMMNKVTSLFGMLSGGVGGIIEKVSSVADIVGNFIGLKGGLMGKLGGLAKNFIKSPIKSIMSGAGNIASTAMRVGGTAMRVASTVRNVAMVASLATGGTLASAVTLAGTAAAGIMSVLASPVVLGAVVLAATGYGAYKAFKYITRNSVNEYEKIRMYQYGLGNSSDSKQYYGKILHLESYLLDGKIGYNGGTPYILDKKVNIEEMLAIFSIDKEDDEACGKFAQWFSKRFKPFFYTHLAALFSVNSKTKLPDIDKLDAEKKLKYLSLVGWESGPYNEVVSPFKDLDNLFTNDETSKIAIDDLIEKLKKDVKTDGKEKSLTPPVKPVPKKPDDVKNVVKASYNGEEASQPQATAPSDNKTNAGFNGSLPIAEGPVKRDVSISTYAKLGKNVSIDNLNPKLRENLMGMIQEYGETTGKSVKINSGSRTFEQQQALYNANPSKAAKPGRSLHEFGLAVDMDSAILNEMDKMGLMRKYGFTRPVGGEPWHMEPAGIQADIPGAKSNPGQADMMVAASLYKGGGGFGAMSGSPLGKRNTKLQMDIINNASDKTVENKNDVKETMSSIDSNPVSKKETTVAASAQPERNIKEQSIQIARADASVSEGDGAKPPSVSAGKSNSGNDSNIKERIATLSKQAGVDPEMAKLFAAMESGFNPNAKAKRGTAAGLFGFVDGTWKETVGKYGKKYGIDSSAKQNDVDASIYMGAELIKANLKSMQSVKPNAGPFEVYLAHFLGDSGAKAMLSADPNQIAAKILPEAAKSNVAMFYMNNRPLTVGQFLNSLRERVKRKASAFGINVNIDSPSQSASSASQSQDGASNAGGVTDALYRPSGPVSGANRGINKPSVVNTAYVPENNSQGSFDMSRMSAGMPSAMNVVQKDTGVRNINNAADNAPVVEAISVIDRRMQETIGILKEMRDIMKSKLTTSTSTQSAAPEMPQSQPSTPPGVDRMVKPSINLDRKIAM